MPDELWLPCKSVLLPALSTSMDGCEPRRREQGLEGVGSQVPPSFCIGKSCHYQPVWLPGYVDPLGDNRLCTGNTRQHLVLEILKVNSPSELALRHRLLTVCTVTSLPSHRLLRVNPLPLCSLVKMPCPALPCSPAPAPCTVQRCPQLAGSPGARPSLSHNRAAGEPGSTGETPPLQPPKRGGKSPYRFPPGTRCV